MVNNSFRAHRSPGIFQCLEVWNSCILMLWWFHCPSFIFIFTLHLVQHVFTALEILTLWCLIWNQVFGRTGAQLSGMGFALDTNDNPLHPPLFYFTWGSNTPFSPHSSARKTALVTRLPPRPLCTRPSCPWLTHLMLFTPLLSWHFWTITCHLA